MKRISNLFLCLVLAVGAAAYAQETMNKTVSGRVISSSAFDLVVQTDAGTRLNLVMDSATSKPAIVSEGDQVTVVYHALDTGGFQAVQVVEGTEAAAPAKPGGTTTRTLTNTGTPGTNGQTGESRSTVVGTTGGYQAPAKPMQPNDPNRAMETTTDSTMGTTAAAPMNDTMDKSADTMDTNHTMANDTMANDKMANDTMASKNTMANDTSLPQTASPEPAVFVFGLLALGAAALLMRQRTTH
ncbi:MAG: hypothetical protein ABJC13_00750 [Acidobacteriota bacterium]